MVTYYLKNVTMIAAKLKMESGLTR